MIPMIGAWCPRLTGGLVENVSSDSPLGITGSDLQQLRPALMVKANQRVAAGDILFRDRKRSWITAIAPAAGRVSKLELGARRSLSELEILPEGDAVRQFTTDVADRAQLIDLMIASGLWTALRTRPFGRIPDPSTQPEALFVTLTEGAPGMPDPAAILPDLMDWFTRGLSALTMLSDGPVNLCHPPDLALPEVLGIRTHPFRGGLASAHIHTLHPVAHGGMVWQIHWQEVAALGHLLKTGTIWPRRIVALTGSAMARPGLIAAPIGARLHDLAAGRLKDTTLRLLAGGENGSPATFLRPGIRQISAVPHERADHRKGWFMRLTAPRIAALIPNPWDEVTMPPGILAVPLLRALASGDLTAARDLGVLGLIEEDLMAFNARLRGHPDYRVLLRQTLDELEATI